MEIVGDRHCPDPTVDQCAMLLRIGNLATSGKGILHWNWQWDISTEVNYFISSGAGKLLNFPEIPLSCCKLDLLNVLYLRWNMSHWKEKIGLVCHILSPGPSLLSWQHSPPANMYGLCATRLFLKLPISLFSRSCTWSGSSTSAIRLALFPHTVSHNSPSKPEMIADKPVLTEHWMSLMWKAVLQQHRWPWTLLLPLHKQTPMPLSNRILYFQTWWVC